MNYEGLFLQRPLQGQEEIQFEVNLLFIIITGLKKGKKQSAIKSASTIKACLAVLLYI